MENYFLFILMCIFFAILPGPDIAITTKNTITGGKTGGLKTVFGICSALLIHTTVAVLGLSAIIVSSTLLFSAITYLGAIYLIYLGIKTLWSLKKKNETARNEDATTVDMNSQGNFSNPSSFKQGFLTNILNPKVIILFLTFFPQFLKSENNTFFPFLTMGLSYTTVTAIWCILYVYLLNQLSTFMRKPKTQSIVEGITGIILIGFGVSLFV